MEIVSPVRFAVGIVLLAVAIVLAVRGKRERGLGPQRQLAAICLVGCGIFIAAGLGHLNLWGR